MRLFVAVSVRPTVITQAEQFRQRLRERHAHLERALRWVGPDQMHLTLRFLGETAEGEAGPLATELVSPLALAPFSFTVRTPGWFPGPSRPRVLVREVTEGVEALQALCRAVDERIARVVTVARDDRPFRPHVTLARVREGHDRVLRSLPADWVDRIMPFDPVVTPVGHVTLYRSELTPKGPVHTPLAQSSLAGPGQT